MKVCLNMLGPNLESRPFGTCLINWIFTVIEIDTLPLLF